MTRSDVFVKPHAVILLLGAVLAAGQARAQDRAQLPCANETSTYALSQCLDKALKAADSALNGVYRKALSAIDRNDDMNAEQRRDWKKALQKAQRAWVAFRDADCGEPVGYEWFQGTGMGPATLTCHLEKTRIRTQELTERYADR